MPWTFLLNPRVIGTAAGLLLILGIIVGAYSKGKSVERAKWELVTAKAKAEARVSSEVMSELLMVCS